MNLQEHWTTDHWESRRACEWYDDDWKGLSLFR